MSRGIARARRDGCLPFRLPVASPASKVGHVTRRGRRLRVAIVDDDRDIRDLIAVHVRLDGRFELTAVASDGSSALALLDRPDIDAMILDMHMPVVSGRQVLTAARARRPELRIVAFSADAAVLLEAEDAGAAATFAKGGSLDLLLDAVARAGCAA